MKSWGDINPTRMNRTAVRHHPLRIRALLLLLVCGLALDASIAHAQRGTLAATLRDTTLANGLQVIVVPNPTVPLVTIQVTIRNGAFTQLTEAEEGLPHLLEHMLFRSFGGGSFNEAANKLNARHNGTTGDETVTYFLVLPSSNLDAGVRLLAELMRAPRFEREALVSEQRVVRGELERLAADPNFLLSAAVNRRLWAGAFTRKNAIGNVLTINGATPAKLKEVYERFYVPNNAAIVFSGDVTAQAAFASSARHFARWARADDPFSRLEIPPIPSLPASDAVAVSLDAQDVTLLVRWHGPSARSERDATYAADVFSAYVNDPASEFQMRLVDSGLFQSVTMSYATLAHTGPISLRATTTPEQLVAASHALHREIERFSAAGYVADDVLAIAKKRQEVDWAMAMETPTGLAFFVGELWSVADMDYVRGYVEAMQAQTAEDLRRYAARYLTGRPRVTGVMLSQSTRGELGARLDEALAPWRR